MSDVRRNRIYRREGPVPGFTAGFLAVAVVLLILTAAAIVVANVPG
jgi:hypothetical protein